VDYWIGIILLTLIASSIGTVTGFGTSTIMVPVLSLFLPIPETLLFVGIVHWFGDVWKMLLFKKGFDWKLTLLFGIPGALVSFWAASLPLSLPETLLKRLLGLFLIMYVSYIFLKPAWKIKASTPTALVGGSLSGFFAGVFGVGGAVRSTFLSAYDLPKSVFLFTSGAIGLLIDSSRITQYWVSGTRFDGSLLTALLLSVPTSLIGAYFAKKVVNKIPQRSFRLIIAIALFAVGLRYLLINSR
jgi:hypothetical protein